MPLYEYSCQSCHKTHEVIRKFSDPPLARCPACGGKLARQITSTSFQLKGGGWYKDGYSTPRPDKPAEKKEEPKKAEAKKEFPKPKD